VDYGVGINAGTVLLSPTTLSGAGITVNSGAHQVTIGTNATVTIDSIDFSLNGGWQLIVNSGAHITVTNSKFGVGANQQAAIVATASAVGVLQYDEFNGNFAANMNPGGAIIDWGGGGNSGGFTMEYSYMHQVEHDCLNYGPGNTIKYNAFYDCGGGSNKGVHSDIFQIGTLAYGTQLWQYNLFYYDNTDPGTQGVMFEGNVPWSLTTGKFQNNSIVELVGAGINFISGMDFSTVTNPAAFFMQDNFIDLTGSSNGFFRETGSPSGGSSFTKSGNVNMVTGATQN
jgi:hypothetical protein